MAHISISNGNIKMGKIPSVSLPSGITCRQCDCQKKCYAAKIERLRPSVRKAYGTNLLILKEDPDTYWREVEAAIMMSRFFRFHVSGDIPDMSYLIRMVGVAARQPHCQILCFTPESAHDFQRLDWTPNGESTSFAGSSCAVQGWHHHCKTRCYSMLR